MIKIPIAIETYNQIQNGKLNIENRYKIKRENRVLGSGILKLLDTDNKYTLKDLITLMITISDNSATNEIIDLIGWESVEESRSQ